MATQRKKLSDQEKLEQAQQKHHEAVTTALDKARSLLGAQNALPVSKLGAPKIRSEVVQQLLNEGYESGSKGGVRVPLMAQAETLLEGGRHIAITQLSKHVAGATVAETKQLVQELCCSGKAHVVRRGKQMSLVPSSESVVPVEGLRDLAREFKSGLAWVTQLLKDKSGATVLRSDLREQLEPLLASVKEATAVPSTTAVPAPASRAASAGATVGAAGAPGSSAELAAQLRGAVLAVRDEDSRLASVPAVSRRIRDVAAPEEVKAALLAAHSLGELELRPEGGIARLSEADAELCPIGAGGIPLSWVRLRED